MNWRTSPSTEETMLLPHVRPPSIAACKEETSSQGAAESVQESCAGHVGSDATENVAARASKKAAAPPASTHRQGQALFARLPQLVPPAPVSYVCP